MYREFVQNISKCMFSITFESTAMLCKRFVCERVSGSDIEEPWIYSSRVDGGTVGPCNRSEISEKDPEMAESNI